MLNFKHAENYDAAFVLCHFIASVYLSIYSVAVFRNCRVRGRSVSLGEGFIGR
jgi:hypothetical protein